MKKITNRADLVFVTMVSILIGLANQVFATPILYDVGGSIYGGRDSTGAESNYDVSGFLLIDDTITPQYPEYPEGPGKYKVLMFMIKSD